MRTSVKSSAYVVGAGLAALALASTATAPGAYAASSGDVDVVNTETVQVYVKPDGSIESQRVYEQLTLTGSGTADIANPIEEQGLRNLNGFGSPSVEDGVQKFEVDVDGVERLRSVSEYTGDLPLDIDVEYRLDGELVEPGDVVGEDGELEVLYTARNITAQPQEVSFPDGQGGTTTETVDVPIPIVGSVTTVTPSNFTEVQSDQANMAGDGKGGMKLSFTITLFPPIGSDTAQFGYTAKISDGVVPASSVTALPVNPLDVPSFKSAGESYQSGSDTGVKLAEGATEIDANLLKLRDGAASLLSGIVQLSDGADQLSSGLAGEAAPGARRLADGAGDLDEGLGKIDDGAGKLADGAGTASDGGKTLAGGNAALNDGLRQIDDGAGKLSAGAERLEDGTGRALTGSRDLRNGLQLISGGLDQLSGVEGLPKALKGAKDLKAGVDLILLKVGAIDQPGTLINGLARLEGGATQLKGGLAQLKGDGSPGNPGLVGAKGGVDAVKNGLDAALAPANGPGTPGGDLAELELGLNAIKTNFCATHAAPAQCNGLVDQLLTGVGNSRTNLGQASAGLGQVSGGLAAAIGALTSTPGVEDANLMDGILALEGGAGQAKQGAIDLRDQGLLQVQAGLGDLVTGLTGAVDGVTRLSVGAGDAFAGSGDLADGLGQIDGGAGDLADGAGRLADGTADARAGSRKLADGALKLAGGLGELAAGALKLADGTGTASEGSGKLADGAGDLADGLGDAADGSVKLADGLAQAEDGAPALVDGAGKLSKKGMSKLIDAGQDTAQDYGKLYATIEAGAARADAEKMAYGAPENARGLTAYTYELLGDDGESGRNTKRGLAALGLLGLGGGALLLRRRLL